MNLFRVKVKQKCFSLEFDFDFLLQYVQLWSTLSIVFQLNLSWMQMVSPYALNK